MEFLVPIYLTTIGLAFLASLTSFRWNGPFHLKFFSVLLGITLIVEIAAVIAYKEFRINNSPIYNNFMLLEFCAYTFYYRQILTINKKLTGYIFCILGVSWLDSTILKFGFTQWNSYFAIIGSCCTIVLVVIYYAQVLASSEPVNLFKQPEFIIATAMLIFYTCTIPYLGPLNYLVSKYAVSAKTFLAVLRIFVIIMYSLFTYAFICRWMTRKL